MKLAGNINFVAVYRWIMTGSFSNSGAVAGLRGLNEESMT